MTNKQITQPTFTHGIKRNLASYKGEIRGGNL